MISLGRFNDNDLLIRIAEIETVFHERSKHRADARMACLAQTFDDRFLIRERRFAQFAERRHKSGVARRLRLSRGNAPQAEQENHQTLPGPPEMVAYL